MHGSSSSAAEAIIAALVLVLIICVVGYMLKKKKDGKTDGFTRSPSLGGDDGSITSQLADQRAAQVQHLAGRANVRHQPPGHGAHKPHNPIDERLMNAGRNTRNGLYLRPDKVENAEQNALTTAIDDDTLAAGTFDVSRKTGYDSSVVDRSSWGDQLSHRIDPRTLENHRKWVRQIAPHSQTSMSVDNLDEAVLMANHRVGIRAFRQQLVPQGACTLFVTEQGPADHAAHFDERDLP